VSKAVFACICCTHSSLYCGTLEVLCWFWYNLRLQHDQGSAGSLIAVSLTPSAFITLPSAAGMLGAASEHVQAEVARGTSWPPLHDVMLGRCSVSTQHHWLCSGCARPPC
jgi:hypothetical protein